MIYVGDCLDVMRTLEPNSVDSIVTDPPYGIGFMGKDWDHEVPGEAFWLEMLRVAKPGAYLAAFGGTRRFHRMACAIEDAGWEIRDTLMWVYGSGFPKSKNLGGGRGTALKPAWEPIVLARKPPSESNMTANVLRFGTGGLNIDMCRVGDDGNGRWPANLVHDGSDEVIAAFPDAPGQIAAASKNEQARKTQNCYGTMRRGRGQETSGESDNDGVVGFKMKPGARRLDSGSAARFFYCAKASKRDREDGLADLPERHFGISGAASVAAERGEHYDNGDGGGMNRVKLRRNIHPTVKPTELMRWLCRLVTPQGGLVLDPFAGSGSTGRGAVLEGFRFIGCELSSDYAAIAEARISAAMMRAEAKAA